VDDQLIVADSEDALQISIKKTGDSYLQIGNKSLNERKKTIDFKGRNPARSKIVTNNNIIEKINTVNYPRCSIHVRMLKILLLENQTFSR
jgi:hypothetical protein